jgi:tetratricopeptide (TPR) repeat protein
MKRFFLLLSIVILLQTLTGFAQKPKPRPTPKKKPVETKPAIDEKAEFERIIAVESASERLAALEKFLKDFPKGENRNRALELAVSARAEIGEEMLRLSQIEDGLKMFRLAAREAPKPMSEELYTKVVLQFPTNLFFRGQQAAAIEIAKIIEEKADGDAKQLLGLAAFYLGIENGDEAKRLAEKAIAIDANLPAAYQTLGLANRLNFDLENSVAAYAKALELDAASVVSKRSLAEMKRAAGKPSEAAALYREILEKQPDDIAAQNGLVMSLFDAGKQSEAETEFAKTLEANPNNLLLLVGAAYWYAANNQAGKAVEYAQKAVAIEPRYTWAHIALARGLLAQNKASEAEKTLLVARQYGNFPTLDYEIASARAAAGFYNEAAQDLRKSFSVSSDGTLKTRLGNRVAKEAKNFTELLAAERRASIFQPLAADSAENAERMKNLLHFAQSLENKEATEAEIAEAAERFVQGDDKTRAHREIFVSSRLLQKKIALPKALELVQSAVRGVDAALEVESPASFVLADELYDSRAAAISRGQLIVVPDVPRQTLSTIVRGRIEEIAGWTLYNQEKHAEAAVRLKRAVGILPEKSAWWRSSMWRLGASLEAAGKPEEALDAYIKSYASGEPDAARRTVIETLYQRVNGSLDGLDQRLEAKPSRETSILTKGVEKIETVSKIETAPSKEPKASVVVTDNAPLTKSENPPPQPTPEATPETNETPPAKTQASPTPNVEVSPSPTPPETPVKVETPQPTPEISPTPNESPTVETQQSPTPESTPQPEPSPTPETKPAPTPTPEETPKPVTDSTNRSTPTPTVETTPEPTETPKSEPSPEIKSEPTPAPTPEIKTEPSPASTSERKSETAAARKIEVVVTDNIPLGTLAKNKPETAPQVIASPSPETKPTPVAEEPKSEPSPSPAIENGAPNKTKTEPKPPENKSATTSKPEVVVTDINAKTNQTNAKTTKIPPNPQTRSRSLFDSVVITAPATEGLKPNDEPTVEKSEAEAPREEPETTGAKEKPKTDDSIASGEERPRVVVTDNLTNGNQPCVLTVNQERISIINGGGMIGILAGFVEGKGDRTKITAVSSRPDDVTIELDPEVGKQTNQAFFIVKSVSTKTGVFTLTFDSPCGKREVQVRVR